MKDKKRYLNCKYLGAGMLCSKPVTKLFTKCLICRNDVIISAQDKLPIVCEDCKNAILHMKELLKEKEEIQRKGGVVLD